MEKKEEAAWRLAESRLAALNTGVADDIQLLFDKLSFIFPCKWKGTNIIVLDEYVIEAPYHVVKLLPGANESGMARVVKIVSFHQFLCVFPFSHVNLFLL